MLTYPFNIVSDGDSYLITSPDFPELTTFTDNSDEAQMRARDAFEEAIACRISENSNVPFPSAIQEWSARLHVKTALKTILYQTMQDAGMNRASLAEKLALSGTEIDKLLDLNSNSNIDDLEKAMSALNANYEIMISRLETHQPA